MRCRPKFAVLHSQFRRTSQRQGRRRDREFSQFLRIAHGSLREVETQVLIAQRLRYVDAAGANPILELSAKAGQLITGLLKSLKGEER